MRCQEDGHDVRWYVPNKPRVTRIGEGLVTRVEAWQPHMRWADLVFLTDNTNYTAAVDQYRGKSGPAIIGPTDKLAEWELDRDAGMAQFKRHGIAVADSKPFTDYDAAIKYVEKEGRAFVSKPSGDADKALSYVGKTPEDLIYMLQRWKKLGKLKAPFILQEKIDGCEMAVGGWIGPAGFIEGWCENWEFKKLMPGDCGPNTGEQGTVLRYVKRSKLANKVLKPFEADLVRLGHTGYIDVNCIIDDRGTPWPLEFTMRPGWPTFNIQQVLHHGDHAEWLMNLAEGEDALLPDWGTVAVGVVLSIPDYPYNKFPLEDVIGIPIYGLKPSMLPYVHPCDVMLGSAPFQTGDSIKEGPAYVTAGTYVLVTSGTGQDVEEARRHAYQVMSRISLPASPMWRADIGQRLRHQLPKVQKHGYASGMLYKATPAPSSSN